MLSNDCICFVNYSTVCFNGVNNIKWSKVWQMKKWMDGRTHERTDKCDFNSFNGVNNIKWSKVWQMKKWTDGCTNGRTRVISIVALMLHMAGDNNILKIHIYVYPGPTTSICYIKASGKAFVWHFRPWDKASYKTTYIGIEYFLGCG